MCFNPQSGHEIQKKRPALVLSNDAFNRMTGLAMVCPITSTQQDFPLHVALDDRTSVHGDILCEQLKSLDYPTGISYCGYHLRRMTAEKNM